MKRIFCLILCAVMALSVIGCGGGKEPAQDTSPVRMLVTLGNGAAYFNAIKADIENDLGIEVEFVYNLSSDTTSQTRLQFQHDDQPADIIFTASKTDDALLKDSCIDLLSRSSVTSRYSSKTVASCTTEEGAVYQLPITSKLIGITYNETLLNEMGWDVPETFSDMVDLKAKCDEAGIKFAVTDGCATGHGFNWLFHLMGAQWLSTIDGTGWLEGFQNGSRSVSEFEEQCDYFKRWTEAGLWGSFHTADWSGNAEFSKTRALFWFGLTNSVSGYEGPQYDEAGNETGVILHDTYKSIPWISEDGSNNVYTSYDSCWVYVNKDLEAPDCAEKLGKVFTILEYLAGEKSVRYVNDIGKDTYIPLEDYVAGSDRLYARYAGDIQNGFLQPWYYNSFDMDSIVFTGGVINDYIAGNAAFGDIFTTLSTYNTRRINAQVQVLVNFPDGLSVENTAKLLAIGNATTLNDALESNAFGKTVDVTLAPYDPGRNNVQPFSNVSVCTTVIYPGDFDASAILALVPSGVTTPTGIYMTGAEIKAIVEKGFDPADKYIDPETGLSTYDSEKYGPYPYVCVVKDNKKLKDDETYLVAVAERFLTNADLEAFRAAGRVITGLENVKSAQWGIEAFCGKQLTLKENDLKF